MKHQSSKQKKKINYVFFISSLICLGAWAFASYQILLNLDVRLNGKIINTEIVNFHFSKGGRKAYVEIEGKKINAGGIKKEYKLGDTLQVYYLKGVNTVVQERWTPYRYYCFLGFASILLIIGVALFLESLKGKKTWTYSVINWNDQFDKFQKFIKKD